MTKRVSDRLNMIFASQGYTHEDMVNLMLDTARGTFAEGVSKQEAEEQIRDLMFSVLDLNKEDVGTPKFNKLFNRAMKKNKYEMFEVIEDVVEDLLVQGFGDDPFFMQFVEQKNIGEGDRNEFWTEEELILSVSKITDGNHDIILQHLGEGEPYAVQTSRYGAAIHTDLKLFMSGRKDWSTLVNAIVKAFDNEIKNTMYTEVMTVGAKLPAASQFNKVLPFTKTAQETTCDSLNELIELVSAANDNSEVVIMGTSSAIRKLEKLVDVDWVSEKMKDVKNESGRLGHYEGTTLLEIPQRVKRNADKTLETLIANDILLVMPAGGDRFVKFVIAGDPEIVEVTEAGARVDDGMKYEYQESFGVGVQTSKYFGVVKQTA